MFLDIYGTMYITFIEFILMNENLCRPECMASERIGSIEQKAADKCVHEYKEAERNNVIYFTMDEAAGAGRKKEA